MKKVVIIVGPTAVGKTALAVFLAQRLNGILISSDSIQVYKGLDIISGKDKEILEDTEIKLIDIVSSEKDFNVSEFLEKTKLELDKVHKLPIVVGGTAFYINSLLNGIKTSNIKPNKKLRTELEKLNVFELQEKLKNLNVQKFLTMNNSDRNNPRRLIRAIEINSKNQVVSNSYESEKKPLQNYDVLIIGIFCKRDNLNRKIDKRVDKRIRQGALSEAQVLFNKYERLTPQIRRAAGYKQLFEYLQGNCSLEQAISNWKTAEHQNAKKQMTFFKKIPNINWFDIENAGFEAKVMKKVEAFLAQ